MSAPRWGVGLPTRDLTAVASVTRAARHAEALGFDAIWALDDLSGPGVDAAACLTAAAAATGRIGLGLALAAGRRAPAWSAKHLTAIDALAPGRLQLGFDLADPADPACPHRLSDERVILALARGEPAASAFDQAPATETARPAVLAPGLRDEPLVLTGGGSELALRRAVRSADAWIAHGLSPAAVAAAGERLDAIARECGRRRPRIGVLLDDDGSTGCGSPLARIDVAVPRLSAYTAIGAELFLFAPSGPAPTGAESAGAYERVAAVRDRLAALPSMLTRP